MSKRGRTWRVLDYGQVPVGTRPTMEYECRCGEEALLPVQGMVIAQFGDRGKGWEVVFDGGGAMPATIQCRHCQRVLANDTTTRLVEMDTGDARMVAKNGGGENVR